jgi:hypothetical protein
MTDERMKVSSEGDFFETFTDPVFVSEDWALPREFPVLAELETGERVEISVRVSRERIRARRVSVETASPLGVGSTTLRRVPVRNALAVGCLERLLRVNRQPGGTFTLMPGDVHPEDLPVVKPLIEGLIGYERLRAEEEGS